MNAATSITDELDRRFAALSGRVFAYVGNNEKDACLAAHADGAVFHGNPGLGEARRHKGKMVYAIDPELYANDRLPQAQERFEESARDVINAQVDAGASFLVAPSRFLRGVHDRESIESSLQKGHEFVAAALQHDPPLPAVVPIIVRYNELEDRRWVEPVRESGLPIAAVFAAHTDPLSTPCRIEGAIEIIQAARLACVLRCDMSTVGLMVMGALFGAIGTSSSARHLYLPSRNRGRHHAARSIFIPGLAGWMSETLVKVGYADSRLDDVFRCNCRVCGEHGDVRELLHRDPESEHWDEHSILAAIRLAHGVLNASDPQAQWVKTCRQAAAAYDYLTSIGWSGPAKPGALESWIKVLHSSSASTTYQRPSPRSTTAASLGERL